MEKFTFFNVNANIGRSAYADSQFPDVTSLISHLDYLGIERSLVWHLAARDINPKYGNQKLIKEIESSGAKERLIPSFVITPACFYEEGTLDFLKSYLKNRQVRALSIIPDVSRFEVRHLEQLLSLIVNHKPVIFWDCQGGHNEQATRDYEYLANTFPDIPFVVTQRMWGCFGSVLDLLSRCKNTYIDTSWLHMRDTIELLVSNFGVERVLFGLGYKSHYGASIASLMHASITDEEKGKIAHSNVESLLNLKPAIEKRSPSSPILKDKPLWSTFREGNPINNVEIIDAHGHTPPFTRGWVFKQNDIKNGVEETIAKMDKIGVNRIILTYEPALFGPSHLYNKEGEEILKPYIDRISGYIAFNPIYGNETIPLLDDLFKGNFFVGFKILPSYWKIPVNDPGYIPVWEYANLHKKPILIHTWNDNYNSPVMLKDIVLKYPNASFILGHSGGGTKGRLEAEELALSSKNVYLEFCGSFTTFRPFETSVKIVGTDRVVYGSDSAGHDMAWELGRYLSMPLTDEEIMPGLSANIKRILSRTIVPKTS